MTRKKIRIQKEHIFIDDTLNTKQLMISAHLMGYAFFKYLESYYFLTYTSKSLGMSLVEVEII